MARGSLTKYGDVWRGQLYLGRRDDGSEIRRGKIFHFPHTIEGRRLAEDAQATWVAEIRPTDDDGATMSLDELVAIFYANRIDRDEVSPNTQKIYRWSQQHIADSGLGDTLIRELTVRDVEWFLGKMANDGMAKASVSRLRNHIRQALKYGMRDKWVTENVAMLADMPSIKARARRRSLTVAQAQDVLEAARGTKLEALMQVGMMRALRPGELLGLQWEDVDLEGSTLYIRQALKNDNGILTLGAPKTKKSVRSLALSDDLVYALRNHKAKQNAIRMATALQPGGSIPWEAEYDPVFATRTGGLQQPSNLRRDVKKLVAQAGIPGSWTPYEIFRHTGLSILSAMGVQDGDLIDLAGHVDEKMLHAVYRHQVTEVVDGGIDQLSTLLLKEHQ